MNRVKKKNFSLEVSGRSYSDQSFFLTLEENEEYNVKGPVSQQTLGLRLTLGPYPNIGFGVFVNRDSVTKIVTTQLAEC